MALLEGKVIFIAGAGASGPGWGNGKASAVAYARAGARVVAVDLDLAAAEATAEIIADEGGTALALACNVADGGEVAAAVAAAVGSYGRIDVLHNNVGILELGGPVELAEAAWRRVLEVNVTGMFLTCKHVIPHLLDGGGGVITNISSIAAKKYTGWPAVAYAASKGAVNGLTKDVALEYAGRNIRCNAILPGLMNTPMIVAPLENAYGAGGLEQMIEARDAQTPTGKMGDAWDVAHLAVFLASDQARYINGAELPVDGGLLPS